MVSQLDNDIELCKRCGVSLTPEQRFRFVRRTTDPGSIPLSTAVEVIEPLCEECWYRHLSDVPSSPTINRAETEVGKGWFVDDNIFAHATRRQTMVVVVSGPDADNEICVMAGSESYLSAEVAEQLAREILRRLGKA